MALDLGLTTRQLMAGLDGVVNDAISRAQRLDDTLERGLAVPIGAATARTDAVGRRPYVSARTGDEGCWAASPRRRLPATGRLSPWTAPTSTWTAACLCAAT